MINGKRILMVHSSSELYGSDRCLGWIARELKRRGAVVHAILPFRGPLADQLTEDGVAVSITDPVVFRRSIMQPVPLAGMMLTAGPNIWRLKRYITNNRIDLVHSNTGVVIGGALAARLAGVPHVCHFREILSEFRRIWKLNEGLVAFTSTAIICISETVAAQFAKAGNKRKISVISDGIPLPEAESKANSRGGGPFRVLTVGRLARYKGQDVLIDAVKILQDRRHDVRLKIVGDVFDRQVGFREELKRQVASLALEEHVSFEGFRKEVDSYYQEADLFVLSSRRPEGLGLVVLEAMAHATPVVATRAGAIIEIISDRENGLLVEPDDADEMADRMEEVIRDGSLAASLAEAGRRTVTEHFSVESMVDKVIGVFEGVISEK